MSTRKELIDQVRQEQRSRSLLARADNPKPAIVGIGKRDPQTGLHDVLLPDGSTETGGEKQFNSALPEDAQVLGIPKEDGGWVLDERDVVPKVESIVDEPGGKIKYLYSLTQEGQMQLYVAGWRKNKAKPVVSLAVGMLVAAQLDNLGGERYRVDLVTVAEGAFTYDAINGDLEAPLSIPVSGAGLQFYGYGFAQIAFVSEQTHLIQYTDPPGGVYEETRQLSTTYLAENTLHASTGQFNGEGHAEVSETLTSSESPKLLTNSLTYTETFNSFKTLDGSGVVNVSLYSILLKRSNGSQSIGTLQTENALRPCWIDTSVQAVDIAFDFAGSLDVQSQGFTRFALDSTFPGNQKQKVAVEQYDRDFVKSPKDLKVIVYRPPKKDNTYQFYNASYHR